MRRLAGLEIEEVGRRIERAQRPVHVEGVDVQPRRPALRDHGLVDLSLGDRLARRGDGLEEALARHHRNEADRPPAR